MIPPRREAMEPVRQIVAGLLRSWETLRIRYLQYQPVALSASAAKERDASATEARGPRQMLRRVLLLPPKRLFSLLLIAILIVVSVLTLRRPHHHATTTPSAPSEVIQQQQQLDQKTEEQPKGLQGVKKGDHRFVIVLPTDGSSPDLCKTISSALAMGYPMPVVVNWNVNFPKTFGATAGSHLAKVTGVLAYLDELSNTGAYEEDKLNENDLVLIIDSYDVWFQLPPEVLLRRYHETNAWANDRLSEQWGEDENGMPMKQTILVSSQKRCYPPPEEGFDPRCSSLPDSPLPADTYGPDTDSDPAINPNGYHDIRPKFMNSGTILGPVVDVRRFFRRALDKMDEALAKYEVPISSDQGIFSEILGEQEVERAYRRAIRGSSHEDQKQAIELIQRDFEMHVGLDYFQTIAMTTAFAEEDGTFVRFEDQEAIELRSDQLGIPQPRLTKVPPYIEKAHHPLDNRLVTAKVESYAWANYSLYSDFFTGSVPVLLHHNGGEKERRVRWWDRTWYFPYLRELVKTQLMPPQNVKPLARMKVDPSQGGGDIVYWPHASDASRRLPRTHRLGSAGEKLGTVKFDALCRYEDESDDKHWYDEVFRDGRGGI